MHTVLRIDTLPFDVILHILQYITDWEDILSLEKASPLIHKMFEQRDMWSTLVTTYIDPPLGMPKLCQIERPIYTYNVHELRDIFKRWKVAENIHKTASDPDKPRIRDLKLYFSAISNTSILAPGGRWLVAITYDATGFYHDLDDPETSHALPLFPQQTGSPLDATIHSKRYDIGTSQCDRILGTQTLSFRFALWIPSTDGHRPSIIQMWQTTLVFDEDLGESRLSARKVASIPFDISFGYISIRSLVKDHLVLNIESLAADSDKTALVLFNWKEASQTPSTYERRVIIAPVVNTCSIIESQLFVSSLLDLKVYDYQRFHVSTSWNPAQFNNNVEPFTIFHGAHYSISDAIHVRTTAGLMTTILALGDQQILSINMESNNQEGPRWSAEVIGTFPRVPMPFFSRWMGYRNVLAIDDDQRLIIGHSRSIDAVSRGVAQVDVSDVTFLDISMGSGRPVILHYDESIGRLILNLAHGTARVRIIDFAG